MRLNQRTLTNWVLKYPAVFGVPFSEFAQLGELIHGDDEHRHHIFIDNNSDILAVVHADSVRPYKGIKIRKDRLYCSTLDDRLGMFIILVVLPNLGINVDVLITDNEEWGRSTAESFVAPEGKSWNWMVQFDRMGMDVATYQYGTKETDKLIKAVGMWPCTGTYTCIADLDHLGISGFNWGVCYEEYHTDNAHTDLKELALSLRRFRRFYLDNKDTKLPYTPSARSHLDYYGGFGYSRGYSRSGTALSTRMYYHDRWNRGDDGRWTYSPLYPCAYCQKNECEYYVEDLDASLCISCLYAMGYTTTSAQSIIPADGHHVTGHCDHCHKSSKILLAVKGSELLLCEECDYKRSEDEVGVCEWCNVGGAEEYDDPQGGRIALCSDCYRWFAEELAKEN